MAPCGRSPCGACSCNHPRYRWRPRATAPDGNYCAQKRCSRAACRWALEPARVQIQPLLLQNPLACAHGGGKRHTQCSTSQYYDSALENNECSVLYAGTGPVHTLGGQAMLWHSPQAHIFQVAFRRRDAGRTPARNSLTGKVDIKYHASRAQAEGCPTEDSLKKATI